MGQTRTGFTEVYAQSLSVDCDLDLWPSSMVLVCDTSSCHIICAKLFSNPTMHNKVMCRTRTGFTEVYAQNLSADCDLDRWPSDMVLVRDTSSFHDDHTCQIIFESHHVRLSYGPDTILEHTHTDRVNSICPSAISWRGHKNVGGVMVLVLSALSDNSLSLLATAYKFRFWWTFQNEIICFHRWLISSCYCILLWNIGQTVWCVSFFKLYKSFLLSFTMRG